MHPRKNFRSLFGTLSFFIISSMLLSACGTLLTPSPTPIPPTATVTPVPPTATSLPTPTTTSIPEPTADLTATEAASGSTSSMLTPVATTESGTSLYDTKRKVSERDGMEQILIPAGEFLMGAGKEDHEAQLDLDVNGVAFPEIPQFSYSLPDYWIDKTEVTNAMYAQCVAEGACVEQELNSSFTHGTYYGNPEFDNYPVVYMSWWMASDYCAWAGRKLPTEAEWEKAARGVDGQRYTWGNSPITSDKANFCDVNCIREKIANPSFNDGFADLAPVGSFPAGASPYGVLDMAGNAWEWTSTIPALYPYDPGDGREDQQIEEKRIWRGSGFSNGTWWLRASMRYRSVQKYRMFMLGFRCVEPVQQ